MGPRPKEIGEQVVNSLNEFGRATSGAEEDSFSKKITWEKWCCARPASSNLKLLGKPAGCTCRRYHGGILGVLRVKRAISSRPQAMLDEKGHSYLESCTFLSSIAGIINHLASGISYQRQQTVKA